MPSSRVPVGEIQALEKAAERIRIYHQHQKQESWSYTESDGTVLGQKITPMEKVVGLCSRWKGFISFFGVDECYSCKGCGG